MRNLPRILKLGAVILCLSATIACAPKAQDTPQPPLTEAYRLMDKGDNEKAAILLEQYVSENPDSEEAKVLLASAYMGEAGVDIYKLYGSFKDIIFNKPLSQRFWGGSSGTSTDDLFGSDIDTKSQSNAPLEVLAARIDSILAKSKKIIEFLNRFPDVPKEKWPLLDSGLALLDGAGNERDLCLYRVFFRVIYVKAYIGQNILSDPDVGSKKWLCTIDLGNLRENLDWITTHLSTAAQDLRTAIPSQGVNINSVQSITDAIKDELDGLNQSTVGANTGSLVLQSQFRSALRCSQ